MTYQLFSSLFCVVQRSLTLFFIGTRFSLALGRKRCCRQWGWNKSLIAISNLGLSESLIYLFCFGQIDPSAFIVPEKEREEGQDPSIWFHKAKVVPPASWQREKWTITFPCNITDTNSAGWSLRWHNIFFQDTQSGKQVFHLSLLCLWGRDYTCLQTKAQFSKPGAHLQASSLEFTLCPRTPFITFYGHLSPFIFITK